MQGSALAGAEKVASRKGGKVGAALSIDQHAAIWKMEIEIERKNMEKSKQLLQGGKLILSPLSFLLLRACCYYPAGVIWQVHL